MKKLLLCALFSVVFFTGCGNNGDITVSQNQNVRFQKTENVYSIGNKYWHEYFDTETNNLYIMNNSFYGGGLSPLYDEHGNIAKYNR